MFRFLTAALLLSLPLLSGAKPAAAEGQTPLRQAALSAELYALGLAQGDALLMMTAAQMRKNLDLQPVSSADAGGDRSSALQSWEEMMAEALELVPEADPLRELAEDIAGQSYKGVISGPVYRIETLAPGGEARHGDLNFRGGEYAEVYAESDPGTDLQLTVYDEAGLLVCADSDPSHVAYCGWTPGHDGSFTLVLSTGSGKETHYALMTN